MSKCAKRIAVVGDSEGRGVTLGARRTLLVDSGMKSGKKVRKFAVGDVSEIARTSVRR